MFHVPTNETWDPEAIAERLREQNLEAIVLADSVRITLPTTPPSNLFERLLNFVARTGPHYMVLSFDRRQFISNIAAEYNPLKISTDTKVFTQIGKACEEIGYWYDTDRKIALKYCPDSAELRDLLDEVEQLQIEIENFVSDQNFEQAAKVFDDKIILKQRIDAILFETTGKPDDSADDPVES